MVTDNSLNIQRIQSLTDAVFAVAMTLLILEVRLPAGFDTVSLKAYFLTTTAIELFVYAIGFITLGIFWIGSHFHHHHIKKTDRVSSWLNILFLMFICVIPFSIGFINKYKHTQEAIIFFCTNLILITLVNVVMLLYAWKKQYIKEHFTKAHFRNTIHRTMIPAYCYVLIILISFMSTSFVLYLFLVPALLHLIPEAGNKNID